MLRRILSILLLTLLALPPWVAEGAVTLWQREMILRDKIESRDGTVTEFLFFDRKGGEFSVDIENETRKVIGFSGVFRGLNRPTFDVLKARIDSLREHPGVRTVEVSSVTYGNTGRQDLILKFDLRNVDVWLTQGNYRSLADAARAAFRLNIKRMDSRSLGISIAMEFEQAGRAREMRLLDWVRI